MLKKRIDRNSIVFLGDSLTEWFNLEEYFARNDLVNRGVAGDITDGVLYRLGEITNARPAKIFLMIGVNDVFQGYSDDHIAHNIKTIIDRILEETPGSKLLVQSILPVNEDYFIVKDNLNSKIVKINQKLKDFCKLRKLDFIDLHKDFLLHGKLNPDYTYDGGHLTEQGYKNWAQILKSYIN